MTVQEKRYNNNREKYYILWLTHEGKYIVDTCPCDTIDQAAQHVASQLKYDVYKAGKILDKNFLDEQDWNDHWTLHHDEE